MSKCSICGEMVSRWSNARFDKSAHYQTVHPDLIGWYNHFRKIFLATGMVVICMIVAANVAWYEIAIGVPPLYIFLVFEAWVAIILVDFQLNFRRFKKSWKAAHPPSAEHIESGTGLGTFRKLLHSSSHVSKFPLYFCVVAALGNVQRQTV